VIIDTSALLAILFQEADAPQYAQIIRRQIHIEAVTFEQVRIARQAYPDYGKGHHPAGLNFGDVFAYALAKSAGEPLLYKGQDFGQTDITAVPMP
jgi:ribonuclease VapC